MKKAIISTGEWKGAVFVSSNLAKQVFALNGLDPLNISSSSYFKRISGFHVALYENQPQQHTNALLKSLQLNKFEIGFSLKNERVGCYSIFQKTFESSVCMFWRNLEKKNRVIFNELLSLLFRIKQVYP